MKVTIAKSIFIIISSIFYVIVGIKHFIDPGYFLNIVPPYLPFHLELVYISGVFEVLFGIMILLPKYRYIGSIGLMNQTYYLDNFLRSPLVRFKTHI